MMQDGGSRAWIPVGAWVRAARAGAWLRGVKTAGGAVLDTLLPPRCLVCGVMVEVDGPLCPTCWPHLSSIAPPLSDHCGLPFGFQVAERMRWAGCLSDLPPFVPSRRVM